MKLKLVIIPAILAVGCSLDNTETKSDYLTVTAPSERMTDAIQGLEESQAIEYPMLHYESPGAKRNLKGDYGGN